MLEIPTMDFFFQPGAGRGLTSFPRWKNWDHLRSFRTWAKNSPKRTHKDSTKDPTKESTSDTSLRRSNGEFLHEMAGAVLFVTNNRASDVGVDFNLSLIIFRRFLSVGKPLRPIFMCTANSIICIQPGGRD